MPALGNRVAGAELRQKGVQRRSRCSHLAHTKNKGAPLEHRIRVRRFFWDNLEHVPVLNDLSVCIQPKNVYTGPITVFGPFLMAMQHHIVSLRNHSLERNPLTGILFGLMVLGVTQVIRGADPLPDAQDVVPHAVAV